jgi:multidrug efflux pump subunit AcrB
MNLGRLSVNQPILAMVLSIVLLIVGAIAYRTLPVAEYPEVVPPTVVVTAQYPGASAQTISDTVAAPIEQQINGVDDMLYLYSQATSNGQLTITVTFKLGTDLDKAQVLVQNRVAIAQPQLPEEGAAHRRHHQEGLARHSDGRLHAVARRHPRPALHLQLCVAAGARPVAEG